MKKLKRFSVVVQIVLICFLFATSCQKEDVTYTSKGQNAVDEKLIDFLVSIGFKKNSIQFDNKKDMFTIEGDILISKAEVSNHLKKSNSISGRVDQYRRPFLVSDNHIYDIKVFYESVPSEWLNAVSGVAYSQGSSEYGTWASVNPHRLRIYRTFNSSIADVVIRSFNEDSNVIANAEFPFSDGRPGSIMNINTKFNSLSSNEKTHAIIHEFGHILGFEHTDTNRSSSAFLIPGTPQTDSNSIMNAVVSSSSALSTNDKLSLQMIYPVSISGWQDDIYGSDTGSPLYIRWDGSIHNPSSVKIELFQNANFIRVLGNNVIGVNVEGTLWLSSPAYFILEEGTGFNVKITSNDNPNLFDFKDFDFYSSDD